MKQFMCLAALGCMLSAPVFAAEATNPQDATTTDGKRIILNSDGSWQHADDTQATNDEAKNIKDCPPGSQGGWFGTRCIPPGDKDFNRGSLSRKGR